MADRNEKCAIHQKLTIPFPPLVLWRDQAPKCWLLVRIGCFQCQNNPKGTVILKLVKFRWPQREESFIVFTK